MLLNELKRRNVLPVLGAYLAAGWLLMKSGEVVFPTLDLPDWSFRAMVLLMVAGFPLAGYSAWLFELTDDGIRLQSDLDLESEDVAPAGRALTIFSGICLILAFTLTAYTYTTAIPVEPDVIDDLEISSAPNNAIAVLPFANLSDDKDNEYFAEGLAEELLDMLAGIHQLRVTSRTSAFSFKGKDVDLATIGRELNVAHVLEGSVRKSGTQIRVSVKLVSVADGYQLWSEKYDRSLKNVFELQTDIANKVVSALKISLLEDQLGVSQHAAGVAPQAYDLYLQARYAMRLRDDEGTKEALELLQRAVAIDPRFSMAYSALGQVHGVRALRGFGPFEEGFARAETEARRALALEEHLAEPYYVLGNSAMFLHRDWKASRANLERALAINPNNSNVLAGLAGLEHILGNLDQSVAYSARALELDPLSYRNMFNHAFHLHSAGETQEAIEQLLRTLELNPEGPRARAYLAPLLAASGQSDRALETLEAERSKLYAMVFRPIVYHALDRPSEADVALQELIDKHGDPMAFQVAEAYGAMGRKEEALHWLEHADQLQDGGLVFALSSPYLRGLHGEPRFNRILEKQGLPQTTPR